MLRLSKFIVKNLVVINMLNSNIYNIKTTGAAKIYWELLKILGAGSWLRLLELLINLQAANKIIT